MPPLPSGYIARRLLSLALVLLGISLIAFVLGVISPGDPAEIALSKSGMTSPAPEQVAAMRAELGLDDPLPTQYLRWLGGVLHGDLGTSYNNGRPVLGELSRRLPFTLKLGAYAVLFACLVGFSLGIASAMFHDRWPDRLIRGFVNIVLSVPAFWLALLMILLFAEMLGWLPTSGVGNSRHMLMPAIVLSSATAASLVRLLRASLIAEMGKQYFLAASARGFGRWALLLRTALPSAILPTITMVGNYIGGILGGSAVVETLFAPPGIGSYAIDAIGYRDYPALQGYVLLTGLVFVLISLAVDILCALLDPRIRLGGGDT